MALKFLPTLLLIFGLTYQSKFFPPSPNLDPRILDSFLRFFGFFTSDSTDALLFHPLFAALRNKRWSIGEIKINFHSKLDRKRYEKNACVCAVHILRSTIVRFRGYLHVTLTYRNVASKRDVSWLEGYFAIMAKVNRLTFISNY